MNEKTMTDENTKLNIKKLQIIIPANTTHTAYTKKILDTILELRELIVSELNSW